jgi:hypothetical protein
MKEFVFLILCINVQLRKKYKLIIKMNIILELIYAEEIMLGKIIKKESV